MSHIKIHKVVFGLLQEEKQGKLEFQQGADGYLIKTLRLCLCPVGGPIIWFWQVN